MKHSILIILISIVLFSCQNNEIEGEVYVKLIDVHNIYGISDDKVKEFKARVLSLEQEEYSASERKLNQLYKTLIDNNIFNTPHFKIKMKTDEIINVYTSKEEYSKIYSLLENLNMEEEKILIKFKGKKISDGVFDEAIYKASKIVLAEKTKGVTDWQK